MQKGGAFALYFSLSRRESKKERKEWKFIPTPLPHLPILRGCTLLLPITQAMSSFVVIVVIVIVLAITMRSCIPSPLLPQWSINLFTICGMVLIVNLLSRYLFRH